MVKIQKISPKVQTVLRTGITINDAVQCVIELEMELRVGVVQNSLDAQSTSIAVRINLDSFVIQVVDNGHGLTKEELDLIGTRYMTSKCHTLNDLKTNIKYYGFRGEALVSIRESCGVLMVISRHRGSEKTYSKVFRANKESHCAGEAAHSRLCDGTTVIVKDFLHNLPVRRARIQPAIEIENIRHVLLALSIINHKVSFTLRNDVTKTVILQTCEYANIGDALRQHFNMKEKHVLIPVSVFIPPFKVVANISRVTELSGHFQFIFVNKRLVKNKALYKLINKALTMSFYLRNTGKFSDEKSKEKNHCVFVINIQCPHIEYDITYDPKKTRVEFRNWDIINKCLERIVDKFLSTEGSLNFIKKDLNQGKPLNLTQNVPMVNNHIISSNFLYGASKKRAHLTTVHDDCTKAESTIKRLSVEINNDKNCFMSRPEKSTNNETLLSTAKSVSVKEHKTKSCGEFSSSKKSETNMSINCVSGIKSDIEDPLPFKVPEQKSCFTKRKYLSEHIITESESDQTTPAKKKNTLESTISKVQNTRKTILPITCQDFCDIAVRNMMLTSNFQLSNSVSNEKHDSLSQTLEINLYRSIKRVNNSESFRLSQKHSLNYVQGEKCLKYSESIQSTAFSESSLKNLPQYLVKNKNPNQLPNLKIKPKLFQKKSNKILVSKKIKDHILNHNKNHCNLYKNWNIFTPMFKTLDTSKRYKSLNIIRTKGPKNIKYKSLMTLSTKVPTVNNNIKSTLKNTDRIMLNREQIIVNQDSLKTHTKLFGSKSKKYTKIPKYDVNYSDSFQINQMLDTPFKEKNHSFPKMPKTRVTTTDNKRKETCIAPSSSLHREVCAQNMEGCCFTLTSNYADKTYLHAGTNINSVSEKKKITIEKDEGNAQYSINNKLNINTQQDIKSLKNVSCFKGEGEVSPATEGHMLFSLEEKIDQNQNYKNQIVCADNYSSNPSDPLQTQLFHKYCTNSFCKNEHCSSECLSIKNTIENHVQEKPLKGSVIVIDLTQYVKEGGGMHVNGDIENGTQHFHSATANILPRYKQNTLDLKESCELFAEKENFQIEPGCDWRENTHLSGIHNLGNNMEMNNEGLDKSVDNKYQEDGDCLAFTGEEARISMYDIDKKCDSLLENGGPTCGKFITEVIEDFNLESNHNCEAENYLKTDQSSLTHASPVLPDLTVEKTEVSPSLRTHKESSELVLAEQENINPEPLTRKTNMGDWNKEITPNGKIIYINSVTGMSSFSTPIQFEKPYILRNRYWFMPKGISPLAHNTARSNHDIEEISKNERDTIRDIVTSHSKPNSAPLEWKDLLQIPERVLNMMVGGVHMNEWDSSYKLKKPCVFSNESILKAKVIGQVDKKFIAALLKPHGKVNVFLVLFDQHAVDERIRVEILITGYKHSSGNLKSQSLNPSAEIFFTENEITMITELLPRLSKLGIKLVVEENKISVCEIPLCLFNKIAKENQMNSLRDTITAVIHQLQDSRGVTPSLPHCLAEIINSEACRGAIKFGDKLSWEESKLLLAKLALCEMPFQCAHGRPVLTPLMEIDEPKFTDEPIHLMNLARRYIHSNTME